MKSVNLFPVCPLDINEIRFNSIYRICKQIIAGATLLEFLTFLYLYTLQGVNMKKDHGVNFEM